MEARGNVQENDSTLDRVERNDPTLKALRIGHLSREQITHLNKTCRRARGGGGCAPSLGIFASCDEGESSRLGEAIGRNTSLESLVFDGSRHGLGTLWRSSLLEGLGRNVSVSELTLKSTAVFSAHPWGESLARLALLNCDVGWGGISLAPSLRACTRLESLSLGLCDVGDDRVDEFFAAIRSNHRLENLYLVNIRMGSAGCGMLASWIKCPDCPLRNVDLRSNPCGDAGALALADALAENRNAEVIYCDSRFAAAQGNRFARALCDASSVNDTFASNHTLRHLGDYHRAWPPDMSFYLDVNATVDKGEVAVRKILRSHRRLDMAALFQWELRALPPVAGWFDRARAHAGRDDRDLRGDIDGKEMDAIYQFLRAFPEALESPNHGSRAKRKWDDDGGRRPRPPSAGGSVTLAAELESKIGQVLTGLVRHENGWVFTNPVDHVELGLPDYLEVVEKPMDLGTVKRNLVVGAYCSLGGVAEDINLTFDNAMIYNSRGTVIWDMANELKEKFAEDYSALMIQLRSENEEERRNKST